MNQAVLPGDDSIDGPRAVRAELGEGPTEGAFVTGNPSRALQRDIQRLRAIGELERRKEEVQDVRAQHPRHRIG